MASKEHLFVPSPRDKVTDVRFPKFPEAIAADLKDAAVPSQVLIRDVKTPMRDGVLLSGDLYLPDGHVEGMSYPVVLIRTPYNKRATPQHENFRSPAEYWTTHNYAVFIQDTRGRFESEGHFYKYVCEADDGYDTVEWLAQQPFCDGNIGTVGPSYLTHVQTSMAVRRPPHLKAMFCNRGGFFNAFKNGIRQGGALEFRQWVWAYKHAKVGEEALANAAVKNNIKEVKLDDWFMNTPFVRGLNPVAAAPSYEKFIFDQMEKTTYSDYWKQVGLNTEEHLDEFADIPMMFISGWYDIYCRSTIDFFTALSATKKSKIQLVMGCWDHHDDGATVGDAYFGLQAQLEGNLDHDRYTLTRRLFDQNLKGNPPTPQDLENQPVRYFRMGGGDGHKTPQGKIYVGGRWLGATTWPPRGFKDLPMYFHPDHGLSSDLPPASRASTTYTFDPRNPCPSIGGNVFRHENILWPGPYNQVERENFIGCKPPYMPIAMRRDVVLFRSPVLTNSLDVTGNVTATLYVSSTALDTDFTVKLVDEYPISEDFPSGVALNITHGIQRTRMRNGDLQEELMEPGKVYKITVDLYPTSNLFKKGHRIAVYVSSSAFPHYDVNPNTGEKPGESRRMVVCDNTIYHSPEYPSHITLPVQDRPQKTPTPKTVVSEGVTVTLAEP